ncbi:hypothetical protein ABZ202_02630 [Streptomyces sp. NPDC006186]|uniref:hypothetical protein n=1 Tax=Streptomyces sp. NPDC006186 TaxID=3155248 RepID=UPI0033BCA8C7
MARNKQKIHKSRRAHRPCPTCGRIQGTDAPHRPTGTLRRRERKNTDARGASRELSGPEAADAAGASAAGAAEDRSVPGREPMAAASAAAAASAPAPAPAPQGRASSGPEPIDAMTLIKGVAARVPQALEEAGADGTPAPGALTSAVRRAVLDEFRTRAEFAGHLAEIDALLWTRTGASRDIAENVLTGHLRELRLSRVTEPEESDRFVVTEGEGDAFELLSPAYVDELTGKVILAGQLRRVAAPEGVKGGESA